MVAGAASSGVGVDPDTTQTGGWIGLDENTGELVTEADCGATPLNLNNGSTTPSSGTFTLTAIWEPEHYSVLYKRGRSCGSAEDGLVDSYACSGETCSGGATTGETYSIKSYSDANITIPDVYTFNGWTGDYNNGTPHFNGNQAYADNVPGTFGDASYGVTADDGAGTISPYNIPHDLTLTAQCTPNQYVVIYEVGTCGGTEDRRDGVLQGGGSYTVNLDPRVAAGATNYTTVDVPSGYSFNGWEVILPSSSTYPGNLPNDHIVQPGDYTFPNWQINGNLTLRAHCSTNFQCPSGYTHDEDVTPTSDADCYKLVCPPCDESEQPAEECFKSFERENNCSCECKKENMVKEYADHSETNPHVIPAVEQQQHETCTKEIINSSLVIEPGWVYDPTRSPACYKEQYNIQYHIVQGSQIISDDPNDYIENGGNPSTYTVDSTDTLLLPTLPYTPDTNYSFDDSKWYFCKGENDARPVDGPGSANVVTFETEVNAIDGATWAPENPVHLCIHLHGACPITYIGCKKGLNNDCFNHPNNTVYQKDMTGLIENGWIDGVWMDYLHFIPNNVLNVEFPHIDENNISTGPGVTCDDDGDPACNVGQVNIPKSIWKYRQQIWYSPTTSGVPYSYSNTRYFSQMELGNCNAIVYTKLEGDVYTVDYDCEGGTPGPNGVPALQSVTPGSNGAATVNTASNSPVTACVKPGWTFKWDCTGTNGTVHNDINPGSSITISSDTHCTPDWTEIKYQLHYNCRNSKTSERQIAESAHRYAENYQNVPVGHSCTADSGKRFIGWKCYKNDANTHWQQTTPDYYLPSSNPDWSFVTNVSTNSGVIPSMPALPVTCYAEWEPMPYNIIYNCDGGAAGSVPPTQNHPHENPYNAGNTNIPLERNGANNCIPLSNKEFTGWSCDTTVSGTYNTSSNATSSGQVISVMPANDVTCSPIWKDRVTITYNCNCGANFGDTCNGNTPAPQSTTVIGGSVPLYVGDQAVLAVNTFENNNYKFDHWSRHQSR